MMKLAATFTPLLQSQFLIIAFDAQYLLTTLLKVSDTNAILLISLERLSKIWSLVLYYIWIF